MTVAYIRGMQAQDVASCIKHLAPNNQENDRGTINVQMDERALREIYLPAFKAAIHEASASTIMGAYNKVRGKHAGQNDYLLNQMLKNEWAFKGTVISDWAGTHDTRDAALDGLDLEMGTDKPYDHYYLAKPFREGVKNGKYPKAALDDKVRRPEERAGPAPARPREARRRIAVIGDNEAAASPPEATRRA